jgi:hypothetical protein
VQRNILKEGSEYLSEPDVILVGPSQLVFVEVKYNELNQAEPNDRGFSRYLDRSQGHFTSSDHVKQAGYYELTRNLVIGHLIAQQIGVPFVLVNLASGACVESARSFRETLISPLMFKFVSWPDLAARIRQPLEPWFADYLSAKKLR